MLSSHLLPFLLFHLIEVRAQDINPLGSYNDTLQFRGPFTYLLSTDSGSQQCGYFQGLYPTTYQARSRLACALKCFPFDGCLGVNFYLSTGACVLFYRGGFGIYAQSPPADCYLYENKQTKGHQDYLPTTAPRPTDIPTCGVYDSSWTLIQQRTNLWDSFNQGWTMYRNGFGNSQNYWMGLESIYQLTKGQNYRMQMQVKNLMGACFIDIYDTFYLGPESANYSLYASGWYGFNGDILNDPLDPKKVTGNGVPFSTNDRDNDYNPNYFCSWMTNGGWWYNDCTRVNLNGAYGLLSSFIYYSYSSRILIIPDNCRMLVQKKW